MWDFFMQEALVEAQRAAALGEVPVGAVVVHEGAIVARGHNLRETAKDPLAHAEIIALGQAAKVLDRWRLIGCTLVVTLEPCAMCAGAIVNARVDHVVFGAFDPKAGVVGSLMNLVQDPRLNHRAQVTSGVMAEQSAQLLKAFFAARRK